MVLGSNMGQNKINFYWTMV